MLTAQKQTTTSVNTSVETITPEIAQEMLRTNIKNRRLNDRSVKHYARQMKNGEWMQNGESIKFDVDGNMIDGQHRLEAVSKSGVTVYMTVVRNLPHDAVKTIDTGRSRSNADNLRLMGFTDNPNVLAAAVKICIDFETGVFEPKKYRLTPTECLAFIDKNKTLLHSMERVKKYPLVPESILVAMHFLLSKMDRIKADVFFQQLFSGADLKDGSPVLALQNHLMGMKSGEKRSDFNRKQYIHFITKAFKAFCSGESVTRFRFYEEAPIVLSLGAE